jgi:lysophospholipase L1-like esterase
MPFTYLALGDSYTIGEGVPLIYNFPYQTVQLLRKDHIDITAPEIIAKTGWTTDELYSATNNYTFSKAYDIVSLLIGVNNQYRGRSSEDYSKEFEKLLQKAIALAGGNKERVFVLSIPDYSVTPFASSMDIKKIAQEIEIFNNINQALSAQQSVTYINITESSREAKNDVNLLAEDGLHPSAAEYQKWAQQLAQKVKQLLV